MEIIFLGTACMQPTRTRNHISVLLVHEGNYILFDCGENTQRQLKIAKISPTKIDHICITHWHGDHVLGIPGMIQTLAASEYSKKLHIYGPKGTKQFFSHMIKAFALYEKIDYKVYELGGGIFLKKKGFSIEAAPLKHGIPTLGYSFKEADRRKMNLDAVKKLGIPKGPLLGLLQKGKQIIWQKRKITPEETTFLVKGKKITYIMDTLPCENAVKLAKESDILICEAPFTTELSDKAAEYKHLTAADAARLAAKSRSKKLILAHFSQRYKTTEPIETEAKAIFKKVECANDFMKIKI